MKLTLACVGRLKADAESTLFDRYWERLDAQGRGVGIGPIDCREIPEGKAGTTAQRQADEAARLLKSAGDSEFIIALDERGKSMTSKEFAALLEQKIAGGTKSMSLCLGGPDGHDKTLLQAAQLKLSLGPMTLPHGLARVVIAEQLYRAAAILAGHPYHRE